MSLFKLLGVVVRDKLPLRVNLLAGVNEEAHSQLWSVLWARNYLQVASRLRHGRPSFSQGHIREFT